MSIRRKKYKKLLQEVKYLRSELEYQEEVLSEYHLLFEEYYRRWCAENNINIMQQEQKNSERVQKILPKGSDKTFSDHLPFKQGSVQFGLCQKAPQVILDILLFDVESICSLICFDYFC